MALVEVGGILLVLGFKVLLDWGRHSCSILVDLAIGKGIIMAVMSKVGFYIERPPRRRCR